MAKRIREKAIARQANADKRPKATAKFVRISPDKVRIVLDIIRGKSYTEALAILKNTPKAATEPLIKVLNSAAANAENNLSLNKDELVVKEAYVNEGQTMKRARMGSRGHVDPIKKRTSHITVVVSEKN